MKLLLEKELKKQMWGVIQTETLLRKWERRLIVALTDEEKQFCKYKINIYKGGQESELIKK